MKWLIVTADDFGITPGVNRGIVQAHREGVLTSTSLMVDRPACEQAVFLARLFPTLSLGLHLELEGIEPARVPRELDRQLERFVALTGTTPTHADSHHDAHRDPRIVPLVRAWADAAGVPLRGFSPVRHVPEFYGQWAGETHLEQIGVDGLLRVLDGTLMDGVSELTCHPGYVEPGFPSSYAVERETEVATLCDPRVRPALARREIRLIGFRDLAAASTGSAEAAR